MKKSTLCFKPLIASLAVLFISGPGYSQTDFWQQTSGPSGGFVVTLAINSSDAIFAGTNGGVFHSTNNGDTWTKINSGLTNTSVRALAINSNGDIFAGTDGGGVFRR